MPISAYHSVNGGGVNDMVLKLLTSDGASLDPLASVSKGRAAAATVVVRHRERAGRPHSRNQEGRRGHMVIAVVLSRGTAPGMTVAAPSAAAAEAWWQR